MAARSIASLSLSFGLVSIPVKLYSATESSSSVRFNLLDQDGSRVKQQYVSEKFKHVVERADLVKGYEFEEDRFVTFTAAELKALEEGARHTIDIVSFIPNSAIDPLYYDKAYFLAPDKRGGKPYALLREALVESGRCALAKWAWKGKQYVVQVRAVDDGLVLQQLLYADEVRSLADLHIEPVDVAKSELQLALQLIEQSSSDQYDPAEFKDEEKQRILEAIDKKIAGKEIMAVEERHADSGGEVVDLVAALRASLGRAPKGESDAKKRTGTAKVVELGATQAASKTRKAPRRAVTAKPAEKTGTASTVRARARK